LLNFKQKNGQRSAKINPATQADFPAILAAYYPVDMNNPGTEFMNDKLRLSKI